jgi:hypothetical protein
MLFIRVFGVWVMEKIVGILDNAPLYVGNPPWDNCY